MTAAVAQHLTFAPKPPEGGWLALGLSIAAHLALVAALALGVQWHHDPSSISAEAELWSEIPQQAAPPAPEPDPTQPPPPVTAPPEPAGPTAADIAIEKAAAKKQALALEQERKAQLERERQAKLAADKRKHDEDLKRQEADKKALADAKAKQEKIKLDQYLEKQRKENLARMTGLAGGAGGPSSSGNSTKSSGPSAGYAGRVTALVRPKIVFTEDAPGDIKAEVEVRCAPDGTIVGRKLVKSSGNKLWDDAVLNAIDKTERLPRDSDGSTYPLLVIGFRPRD